MVFKLAMLLQLRHISDSLSRMAKSHNMHLNVQQRVGALHQNGDHQVHVWMRDWIKKRTFPQLMQGRHTKVYSLLLDPDIAAELHAYVCSNKWAVDPAKLAKFSHNWLVPSATKEYLQHIT